MAGCNALPIECPSIECPSIVVNVLLDPRLNQLHNVDVEEARRRVLSGDPAPSAPSTGRSRS